MRKMSKFCSLWKHFVPTASTFHQGTILTVSKKTFPCRFGAKDYGDGKHLLAGFLILDRQHAYVKPCLYSYQELHCQECTGCLLTFTFVQPSSPSRPARLLLMCSQFKLQRQGFRPLKHMCREEGKGGSMCCFDLSWSALCDRH